MADANTLAKLIEDICSQHELQIKIALDEVTVELSPHNLKEFCLQLRDHPELKFELLMDVCGVDYLEYGISEWATTETTFTGFSRGVEVAANEKEKVIEWHKPRFAVVYHLLSITHNHRLRIRVFPESDLHVVPTLTSIWISADWFEREAFDLYGIIFKDHPDLRRILTDYGFIGYPFRKDFPLIGNVEARYDANQKRVIYEPVSIEARTLVAKVIRDDNRYHSDATNQEVKG